MPKNFKKLLVCIVATFGITVMVFSCCKKIGLCASGGGSGVETFTSFPLPYGNGEGVSSSELATYDILLPYFDDMLSWVNDNLSDLGGTFDTVVVPDDIGFDNYYVKVLNSNSLSFSSDDLSSCIMSCPSVLTIKINYSNNTFAYSGRTSINIDISQGYVETSPSGSYMLKSGNLYCYPLYCTNPDNISDYFSMGSSFSGHSKGGVLSNYIDSDDLIEDSSQVPKVDTSAPANSSSIPDWLQKILNGIGKVNQSIQGGILTLGDFIGSGFEKVGEWFQHLEDSIGGFFDRVHDSIDDIIDTIEGLKDGSTVAQAQAAWEDEFDNSIFKDFVDLKGSIDDDILTPIRNANAPSTLSFTIPLITVNVPNLVNNGGSVSTFTNNVYLFGRSVTLDFSWYTRSISGGVFNGSSIRDYLVPIIATFLYVGMVVHLLFKIPSFLSGSSGFSNTLHSVVVSNNGSKFKKA